MRFSWGKSLCPVFVASAYKRAWVAEHTGQSAESLPLGLSDHKDYYRAKKDGNIDAALRVVSDSISKVYIAQMRITLKNMAEQGLPPPILVAPFKPSSKNVLARSAAVYLGKELGLEVDTDIVETDKIPRKTLSKLGRLFTPATFEGESRKGAIYIMVDDNMVSGSTFADLRSHLIKNGSRVAFACALSTPQGQTTRLKPSDESLLAVSSELSSSVKGWMKNVAGMGLETLTRFEVDVLHKPAGRKELRDLVLSAS